MSGEQFRAWRRQQSHCHTCLLKSKSPYLTRIPACMVLLGLQQWGQVADAPSCHDVSLHHIAETHQPASAGSRGLRCSSALAIKGEDGHQGNEQQGTYSREAALYDNVLGTLAADS